MGKLFGFEKFLLEGFMGGEGGSGGGAGEGGAGAGGEGGAGEGGEGGAGGQVNYTYPETLDPMYHGNDHLLRHANDKGEFDMGKVMQSLVHAQNAMSTEKMPIPNNNFTEDQWKETFQKLGLPTEMDKYGLENNVPEGFEANEEMFTKFKEFAFNNNILPNQAQAMLDFHNEFVIEQNKAAVTQAQADLDNNRKALLNEWGEEGFKRNLGLADQALKHYVPDEEARKSIIATGALDNPEITRLFVNLGKGLAEDNLIPKGGNGQGYNGGSLDKAEIQSKISEVNAELRNMGKGHPGYAAKLNEYQNLFTRLHGNQPVQGAATPRV